MSSFFLLGQKQYVHEVPLAPRLIQDRSLNFLSECRFNTYGETTDNLSERIRELVETTGADWNEWSERISLLNSFEKSTEIFSISIKPVLPTTPQVIYVKKTFNSDRDRNAERETELFSQEPVITFNELIKQIHEKVQTSDKIHQLNLESEEKCKNLWERYEEALIENDFSQEGLSYDFESYQQDVEAINKSYSVRVNALIAEDERFRNRPILTLTKMIPPYENFGEKVFELQERVKIDCNLEDKIKVTSINGNLVAVDDEKEVLNKKLNCFNSHTQEKIKEIVGYFLLDSHAQEISMVVISPKKSAPISFRISK